MEHAESIEDAFEVLRLQNALCPINQLPIEILRKIFVHTREAHDTEMMRRCGDSHPLILPCLWSHNDFKKQLKWINITYVCARWRNVALDDPILWATPSFAFPEWASCMLQRSQRVPLTASVTLSHISPETISTLFQHVSRLETLVVTQCEDRTLPLLKLIFDGLTLAPATTLQRLHIHRFWDVDSSDADMVIPTAAFIDTNNLREVSLSFVDVDWNSRLLSSLDSLSLRNISDARKPTAAQFRAMIERNPNLGELTLENAFPPERQGLVGTITGERVLLSHLKSITLKTTLPQLRFFSAIVAFPPSINQISIFLKHMGVYNLASVLTSIMYQYPMSQIRSVAVEVKTKDGDPFVRFITSPASASVHRASSAPPNTDLNIEFGSKQVDSLATPDTDDSDCECDSADTIMKQLFTSFQWSRLTEPICSHVPEYLMPSDMTSATTFGTLPGLHTLIQHRVSKHV